jgi:cytochrome c biogenesis protein CcdA
MFTTHRKYNHYQHHCQTRLVYSFYIGAAVTLPCIFPFYIANVSIVLNESDQVSNYLHENTANKSNSSANINRY